VSGAQPALGPRGLQLLLAQLEEGVVLHDRDGVVLACNAAAARMLGVEPGELVGQRGLFARRPPLGEGGEPLSPADEPCMEALRMRGPSRPRTVRWDRSSGEAAHLVLRAAALAAETPDEPRVAITFVREAAPAAPPDSGAAAVASMGRVAGSVAHDFNNLITVITGYNDLLLQGLAADDPRRHDAEQVGKAAHLASRLSRQLLAMSGGRVLEPRRLHLPMLLADLSELLQELLGAGIALTQSADLATPAVRADQGQIEQLVLNLVLNAREAIGGSGHVRIDTSAAQLDDDFQRRHPGSRPGRYALLSVTDDGAGMDAETLAHAFDPHFTTRPAQGHGLGLTIVYGIVKQFGGYIDVESEPKRGSTFRVYLPASDERVGAAPAPAEPRLASTSRLGRD